MGSTRLPSKPLANLAGRPLVLHVWERACRAGLDCVVVATDDQRIVDVVQRAGGEAVLTRADHPSGTDRCWEVAAARGHERILNVQGDQPLVDPELLVRLVQALDHAEIATASAPLERDHPSAVKVVCDAAGDALYFSRCPIPSGGPLRQHVGIYAFRRDALARVSALPVSALEQSERLEQLRWLEAGLRIRVISGLPTPSVDTIEDLERVRHLLASSPIATHSEGFS